MGLREWGRGLGSHVDDSGQLLHPVEQQVTLLDGLLVLPVLAVGSVRMTRPLRGSCSQGVEFVLPWLCLGLC